MADACCEDGVALSISLKLTSGQDCVDVMRSHRGKFKRPVASASELDDSAGKVIETAVHLEIERQQLLMRWMHL